MHYFEVEVAVSDEGTLSAEQSPPLHPRVRLEHPYDGRSSEWFDSCESTGEDASNDGELCPSLS